MHFVVIRCQRLYLREILRKYRERGSKPNLEQVTDHSTLTSLRAGFDLHTRARSRLQATGYDFFFFDFFLVPVVAG